MAVGESGNNPPPIPPLSDDAELWRLRNTMSIDLGKLWLQSAGIDGLEYYFPSEPVPDGVTSLPAPYCQLHALEIEDALEILFNLGGPQTAISKEYHLTRGPVTTDKCGWHALDGEACAATAYVWYETEGPTQ